MTTSTVGKTVVLLSSGLDSTYNLYKAKQSGDVLLALTFDYGQKAAPQEKKYAAELCRQLGITHQVVTLDFFRQFDASSLLNDGKDVPTGDAIQMDDLEASKQSAKSVWVPNRNGIFLNIGAGFAEALGADTIVPGFNKEEAATFPDNSEDFIARLNDSFSLSTANQVKVFCFSTNKNKTEIVAECLEMGVNFKDIWPCYFSNDTICGSCESCQRFLRALKANGVNTDAVHVR